MERVPETWTCNFNDGRRPKPAFLSQQFQEICERPRAAF
jgi:hypothetical protein